MIRDRKTFALINRLTVALVTLLAVIAMGTAGFIVIEKRSFVDALYMTLVTISTLGMKAATDPDPSAGGKIWIMVLIVVGIAAAMIALSGLVGFVVEGHMRSILGRRKLNLKISSLSNHIIVCGYGLMGETLCKYLQRQKTRPIVVVEKESERTALAETDGFLYVLGDATEENVLKAAGIERAQSLVTVLPTDAANVFVSLIARGLNPKIFISARAERQETESRLIRAGADKTICPEIIGAKRLGNILTRPGVVNFMDFAAEGLDLEAEQVHIQPNSKLAGKTIQEANLPREVGVLIVAVTRPDGQTLFNPEPQTLLQAEDVMFVMGRMGSMAKLQGLIS